MVSPWFFWPSPLPDWFFRAASQRVGSGRLSGDVAGGYLCSVDGGPPAAQVLTPPVCPADVLLQLAVLLFHGRDLLLQLADDLKTQAVPPSEWPVPPCQCEAVSAGCYSITTFNCSYECKDGSLLFYYYIQYILLL